MRDYYRFGIEEEYFISKASTRNVARHLPKAFEAEIRRALPDVMRPEMLQSQIEVATPPSQELGAATQLLAGYRRVLAANHTTPEAFETEQREDLLIAKVKKTKSHPDRGSLDLLAELGSDPAAK